MGGRRRPPTGGQDGPLQDPVRPGRPGPAPRLRAHHGEHARAARLPAAAHPDGRRVRETGGVTPPVVDAAWVAGGVLAAAGDLVAADLTVESATERLTAALDVGVGPRCGRRPTWPTSPAWRRRWRRRGPRSRATLAAGAGWDEAVVRLRVGDVEESGGAGAGGAARARRRGPRPPQCPPAGVAVAGAGGPPGRGSGRAGGRGGRGRSRSWSSTGPRRRRRPTCAAASGPRAS